MPAQLDQNRAPEVADIGPGRVAGGKSPRRILYVQYTNPACYPPLEHSSRMLADEGWEVLFLGARPSSDDTLEFAPHPRVRVLRLDYCPPGMRQKLQYIWFCLWVLTYVVRWKPGWIYASDLLSCPAALLSARLSGCPLLYHEHDSPDTTRGSGFLRFCFSARRLCARMARCCVLPCEPRVERFVKETGATAPVRVVWNCPTRAEVLPESRPAGPAAEQAGSNGLRLLYQGSIVPARLPFAVLDALARLPEGVTLKVAGYETIGSYGYVNTLKARARELGISHRVQFLGVLHRRAAVLEVCRESDLGLALLPLVSDDFNEVAMAGASNKPFDYLASGAPVLVSYLPDWQKVFVDQGFGVACDPSNADSIAAAILQFWNDRPAMRRMGERGRRQIAAAWNYEEQFRPVLDTLTERQPRRRAN